MKNLIIYYSVSGQTRYMADMIKEQLNCDEFEIKTEEEIKPDVFSRYLKGGKAMMAKTLPKLKKCNLNLDDYDRIIFGFPTWGSKMPPAAKAFIKENDFSGKKVYLFTTYMAQGGAKCLEDAESYLAESTVEKLGNFTSPKHKNKEKLAAAIKEKLDKLGF